MNRWRTWFQSFSRISFEFLGEFLYGVACQVIAPVIVIVPRNERLLVRAINSFQSALGQNGLASLLRVLSDPVTIIRSLRPALTLAIVLLFFPVRLLKSHPAVRSFGA